MNDSRKEKGKCCRSLSPVITSRIKRVHKENYRVQTIEIDYNLEDVKPGQFVMVWIPGVGEKPMSIGNNNPLTISVAGIGKVSKEICKLKVGDEISFRGPKGKGFTIQKDTKKILVIGGGYGIVPMHFLATIAKKESIEVQAIIGGRTKDDIIYKKKLVEVCTNVYVTTDDGSEGTKGNVMEDGCALIGSKSFDCVYACGPERMMYAVVVCAKEQNVHSQVSVERYMKCGVGVCGSCAVNKKFACVDGPVFSGLEALNLSDFGKCHRDASGIAHDY